VATKTAVDESEVIHEELGVRGNAVSVNIYNSISRYTIFVGKSERKKPL
jgi:hypothetical protein